MITLLHLFFKSQRPDHDIIVVYTRTSGSKITARDITISTRIEQQRLKWSQMYFSTATDSNRPIGHYDAERQTTLRKSSGESSGALTLVPGIALRKFNGMLSTGRSRIWVHNSFLCSQVSPRPSIPPQQTRKPTFLARFTVSIRSSQVCVVTILDNRICRFQYYDGSRQHQLQQASEAHLHQEFPEMHVFHRGFVESIDDNLQILP